MTVHVSIGNTDNKLTQQEWAEFHERTDAAIREAADAVHGAWVSPSVAPFQNAAWAFEPASALAGHRLRSVLAALARRFDQDSIAWLAGATEFIEPRAARTDLSWDAAADLDTSRTDAHLSS